ncbi:DNA polymerase III subunit delta [Amedibacillus sp. YH-ame10]
MNYILHGEEQFRLQEALRKIVQSYMEQGDEMNTIVYDALKSDVHVLLEDAQTIPFFSQHKVILIQNANFLTTSDDTGWDLVPLEAYLNDPLESTVLIFITTTDKLDARKKIVKKMKETCKVMVFSKVDDQEKIRYANEQITKRNLVLDYAAKELLMLRLPNDIRSIQNELAKLELFGGTITREIVEDLVTRPIEEDVFQLVNAVVDKDLKKAFHVWADMQVLNKDAIFLIATLASQFRLLYQVRVLMDEGRQKDDIVSITNAHPYRVQLSMNTAKRLTARELLSILERLATLDQQIKSGLMKKEIGFEMFLLSLRGEECK